MKHRAKRKKGQKKRSQLKNKAPGRRVSRNIKSPSRIRPGGGGREQMHGHQEEHRQGKEKVITASFTTACVWWRRKESTCDGGSFFRRRVVLPRDRLFLWRKGNGKRRIRRPRCFVCDASSRPWMYVIEKKKITKPKRHVSSFLLNFFSLRLRVYVVLP